MGLWEREYFFSLTVSHPVISLPLLCVSWHFLLSTFLPFLFVFPSSLFFPFFPPDTLLFALDSTSPDILVLLRLFLLSFFSLCCPLPQSNAARRLHHAATSVVETIASATGEAGEGNVNVKPFDATSWWAPTPDIKEEFIHHSRHERMVNWVAMQKSFMEHCYWRCSHSGLFFPERSLTQNASSWWEYRCVFCWEVLFPGIRHKRTTWSSYRRWKLNSDI